MAYGTPKIPSSDIRKAIHEALDRALDLQDVFQGNTAYYGYTADVEVGLRLITRGDQSLTVKTALETGMKINQVPTEKNGPVKSLVQADSTGTATASGGLQKPKETGV
jgi:hypothetical protein